MTEIRHVGSSDSAWDFFNCDPRALASVTHRQLNQDLRDAGFTIVKGKTHFYRFPGGGNGISFTAIIMESHIAIHTNPENSRLIEVTIHTCNVEGTGATESSDVKKERLYRIWVKRFKPDVLPLVTRERGNIEKLHEHQALQNLESYGKKVA